MTLIVPSVTKTATREYHSISDDPDLLPISSSLNSKLFIQLCFILSFLFTLQFTENTQPSLPEGNPIITTKSAYHRRLSPNVLIDANWDPTSTTPQAIHTNTSAVWKLLGISRNQTIMSPPIRHTADHSSCIFLLIWTDDLLRMRKMLGTIMF